LLKRNYDSVKRKVPANAQTSERSRDSDVETHVAAPKAAF
jgi:hypothetical protein